MVVYRAYVVAIYVTVVGIYTVTHYHACCGGLLFLCRVFLHYFRIKKCICSALYASSFRIFIASIENFPSNALLLQSWRIFLRKGGVLRYGPIEFRYLIKNMLYLSEKVVQKFTTVVFEIKFNIQ